MFHSPSETWQLRMHGSCGLYSTTEHLRKSVKRLVSNRPVLKYYDFGNEEVTLQCDASEKSLGATLLQSGQPVHLHSPHEHCRRQREDIHRLRKSA